MFKGVLKNHKGITLVELLIVLALLTIVLTMAFSFFMLGNKTFKEGSSQYDLQTSVRFALVKMIDDLRFATSLEIIDASTFDSAYLANILTTDSNGDYVNVNQYDTYIFFNNDSVVKLRKKSIETVPLTTDAASPLEFNPMGSPAKSLNYNLKGLKTSDGKRFDVSSDILMLNIIKADGTSGLIGSNGIAIKYLSPDSYLAGLQFPQTVLNGKNDSKNIDIAFVENVRLIQVEVLPNASAAKPIVAGNAIVTPSLTTTTKLIEVAFKKITGPGTPNDFNIGDRIILHVEYGSNFEYEAVYDLSFSSPEWTIN